MERIPEETVRKAAGGDMSAFEALYRQCGGYVYNTAWRIVGRHEDAEEVVQEVFLTVYRRLGGFRFSASFKTWIYRITVNAAIDYTRKISAGRKKAEEYRNHVSVAGASGAPPGPGREHDVEEVVGLLEKLTPEQRACVVLRSVEGLSYQEMADVLRININTVRSRLKRAREVLMALRREVTRDGV